MSFLLPSFVTKSLQVYLIRVGGRRQAGHHGVEAGPGRRGRGGGETAGVRRGDAGQGQGALQVQGRGGPPEVQFLPLENFTEFVVGHPVKIASFRTVVVVTNNVQKIILAFGTFFCKF